MTEEEKKQIQIVNNFVMYCRGFEEKKFTEKELFTAIEFLDELIQKQQKEIVNRDKVIDKMAEELRYQNGMQQDEIFCVEICKGEKCNKEECKDKIKQYFINKAEEK